MSKSCCEAPATPAVDSVYRRVLWIALAINGLMFFAEVASSIASGSVALLADAVDFAGDASNYALSLGAIALGGLAWRSRAALIKGWMMTIYGVGILAHVAWSVWAGVVPEPLTMGAVAFLALLANATVAALLFRFRSGDADMRSVWLCTRNDVLGNVAVMIAALGVFGASAGWPDHAVAVGMALLALSAGLTVIGQARSELRSADTATSADPAPARR